MSDKGRFEAWAKTAGFDLYKYSDATGDMAGEYSCPKTRIAWETWQAAQATPPAVEPVAYGFPNTAITGTQKWMMLREEIPADDQYKGALWIPLYTTPPAVEPVAWMTADGRVAHDSTKDRMPNVSKEVFCIPLYTTPPSFEPLPSTHIKFTRLATGQTLVEWYSQPFGIPVKSTLTDEQLSKLRVQWSDRGEEWRLLPFIRGYVLGKYYQPSSATELKNVD